MQLEFVILNLKKMSLYKIEIKTRSS